MNVKFKNGEIHKIDLKETLKSLSGIKLKCGLVAKGVISAKHVWHFTFQKTTCKHCIKKVGPERTVRLPTDLSNYHTFIEK
jgi:hypothetical protein